MNFLEKVIVVGLTPKGSKTKYVEQGEVQVEINHINSISRGNRYGQMTTEFEYQKYPLAVARPAEGKTVIEHNCLICGAPLKIEVRSKTSLMRVINPFAIAMAVGIALLILGVIFFNQPQMGLFTGIVFVAAVILLLLGAGVLFFTLPLEYQKKGISDVVDTQTNRQGYANHGISQSPVD